MAEQIVRRLDPFRQFLEVAAQSNGTIINYANIARDVGADPKTVNSYFSILEDTLVGFLLPAFETWHASLEISPTRSRCASAGTRHVKK